MTARILRIHSVFVVCSAFLASAQTPVQITTSSLADGLVGLPYSQTLTATGGTAPYTWQITAGRLPSGLTLDATKGSISGTPTQSLYNGSITVQATDSSSPRQTAKATLTLTIPGILSITTTSLANGFIGIPYSQTLTATDGLPPYKWQLLAGFLPSGLTLDSATGVISGTPVVAGTSGRLPFQVSDSEISNPQTATASFTLTIAGAAPPPSITQVNPNSATQGQASFLVTITGQSTHFAASVSQANFGPGISVGGAPQGANGPVTVNSPTSATAQITVDQTASRGPRTVTVTTGAEQASLANGFSVTAPAVSFTSLNVLPNSIAFGTPTPVTATAALTGTPDAGSVMLQRLDSSGRVISVVGTMHDDGLNGDMTANDGVYSLVSSFDEFAVGAISLRASATYAGAVDHALSQIATLTVTGTPPPTISFSAPASLAYLNLSPTTVSGTVSDPTATLVINTIPVTVSPTGAFSAQIPLAEGPNIITGTATSPSGSVGTGSITVTLDTTPPHVTITSPPDQFVTTDASISVAGNVNDIVVGTVNSQQATVTVNGVAATVANRTFLIDSVPLSLGPNTIQAVATDRAGNSVSTQITVTRQAPSPGQIKLLSGNNQTGTIGTAVSQPLVVSLTDPTGAPAVNKPVIFSVTQNNGMLADPANQNPAASSVMVNTNAQGQAQVVWTLGMRAGAGGNAAQAYSVGFGGTALFTATGNQGPAGLIVVDTGNNQTGAVNQPLPKPFIAVVIDKGNNRLAGVPVTFTVQSGGGNINGQPTSTVTSDSDGRVAAILTLGFQEGTSNNVVTADFTGDTGFPATFTASGRGPSNPANTIISGVVLDNSNQPIPGVTIRAVLTDAATSSANSVQNAPTVQSDAKGQFSLYKAPVGLVKLFVDGSTASVPGTYPTLDYDLVTVAGQVNSVNQPIYLLPLKTDNQLCVTDTTGGGTLAIREAPGFSLTFGPGQVTFPGGSKTGCVSVTVVHPDKVPMQPGFGQQPRFIVTIQPSGALFDPPAPITLPNVDGLAPRAVTEMYSFDHDIGSFVAIGTGTVSDDGQVIRSNAGIGVLKAGWHCGGNSNSGGTAATCGTCEACIGNACQPVTGTDPLVSGQCCFQGQQLPRRVTDYKTLISSCPFRTQSQVPHVSDGCSNDVGTIGPIFFNDAQNPMKERFGADLLAQSSTAFGQNVPPPGAIPSLPCNNHDLCYQGCSNDKSQCDVGLRNDISAVCAAAYPDPCPFTGVDALKCLDYNSQRSICNLYADIYYRGVQLFGSGPYQSDQLAYCACCQ